MSQIWKNALWTLMYQGRLGMLIPLMAGVQLKGMHLKYTMRFEDVNGIVKRHV